MKFLSLWTTRKIWAYWNLYLAVQNDSIAPVDNKEYVNQSEGLQPETNILPKINAFDIVQTDIQADVNLSFSHISEHANMDENHTQKKN